MDANVRTLDWWRDKAFECLAVLKQANDTSEYLRSEVTKMRHDGCGTDSLADVQDAEVNYYVLVPFMTADAAKSAAGRIADVLAFDCHVVARSAVSQNAPIVVDMRVRPGHAEDAQALGVDPSDPGAVGLREWLSS